VKCPFCGSTDVDTMYGMPFGVVVSTHGYTMYYCRSCGKVFDSERIYAEGH